MLHLAEHQLQGPNMTARRILAQPYCHELHDSCTAHATVESGG